MYKTEESRKLGNKTVYSHNKYVKTGGIANIKMPKKKTQSKT